MQEDIIKLANVSPEVAGKFLGKSAQFIRCGLQSGKLPFGVAIKTKRWSYHISGEALVHYKKYGIGGQAP
jgi:hypothetical protein